MTTEQQATRTPPTREEIAEYLTNASHDELKAIPVYNQRFQAIISDARTEADAIREEARQAQEQQEELSKWSNYFGNMTPEHRAEALKDPRAAQAWAVLQQQRNTQVDIGQVKYEAVKTAMDAFKRELSQEPGYESFDWTQFEGELNPAKALRKLVDHGTTGVLAEGKARMREEAEAAVNEILAKRGLSRVQPDVLPASGADSGMTYEGLMQMTSTQRSAYRAKDPQLYDQIINQYGAARRR